MPPRTTNDTPLLERVALGEADAVRQVIEEYGNLVWSLARRFTSSDAEAEEAVQDIFINLWRKADQFDQNAGSEVTFVSVLARRQLIDRWRKLSRRPKTVNLDLAGGGSETQPDRAEMHDLAREAFEAFSELERDTQVALRLSIEYGCSHAHIAEMTNTPLGTVKSRIRKGLKHLRERIRSGKLVGASK